MKTKLTDSPIIEALERLAAAFPWEETRLEVQRKPEGDCIFCAVLPGNSDMATRFTCTIGPTPSQAVEELINRERVKRDPEIACAARVRELEEQLRKLRAVTIGLPPYRPGCYLAEGASDTVVEVEARKENVPF